MVNNVDLTPIVLSAGFQNSDSCCYVFMKCSLGQAYVVLDLQVEPKLWIHRKEQAQAQSCVCRDGSFAIDDFADATGGNIYVCGQLPGREFAACIWSMDCTFGF